MPSQTASAERSPGTLMHAATAEKRCLISQALEVPVHVSVRVKALDDIPAT